MWEGLLWGSQSPEMKMRQKEIGRPLVVATAVAVLSAAAFLIVEFGPWNREVDSAATKAPAQAAGAKITPTQPKLAVESTPLGPKPVQPPVVEN